MTKNIHGKEAGKVITTITDPVLREEVEKGISTLKETSGNSIEVKDSLNNTYDLVRVGSDVYRKIQQEDEVFEIPTHNPEFSLFA